MLEDINALLAEDIPWWLALALIVFSLREHLFNLIVQTWDWIQPFTVVTCYESGVILRFGKYRKTIEAGFHWYIPFGVDEPITETVVDNSETLDVQSLTTKDNIACCVTPVIVFNVRDVKKYLLDVEGKAAFLADGVCGSVSRYVRTTNWSDLASEEQIKELLKEIRRRCFRYGVEVMSIEFKDLVKAKSYRLLHGRQEKMS